MKNKKYIAIIAVLLAMAAAIVVLAVLNGRGAAGESGDTVKVIYNGQELAELTMDDIKSIEYVEIEKNIVSGSGKNENGVFRGAALADVIEFAASKAAHEGIFEGVKNINVQSTDGFVSSYTVEEVCGTDEADEAEEIEENDTDLKKNVLLVYEKDGEMLGTEKQGGSGPFRIVVADDQFGNRCAKYVCRIELE